MAKLLDNILRKHSEIEDNPDTNEQQERGRTDTFPICDLTSL